MVWRCFFFLSFQVAGLLLGWLWGGRWGAVATAAGAAWAWFLWDLTRGYRVVRWLREGDLAQAPALKGVWGELADRTRRLLRQKQADIAASDARLQEILEALQATPTSRSRRRHRPSSLPSRRTRMARSERARSQHRV